MTFWHWFLQETFGSPPAVPFLDLPCTAARIVSVWLVQMWGTAEFHKRLAKDLERPGFERCFDKMENNPQYLYQYLMWCTICKSHENKARAWGILPKLSKHDRALKWTLQWTIRSQKARNITCSASPRLMSHWWTMLAPYRACHSCRIFILATCGFCVFEMFPDQIKVYHSVKYTPSLKALL